MENENKKHLKRDLILIAAVLVIAGAGLLYNNYRLQESPFAGIAEGTTAEETPNPTGEQTASGQDIIINGPDNQVTGMTGYVEISIDGSIVETLDLSQDTEMTVTGYNDGTNHLVIENGQVWIDDASCPDKVCIHQGKISRNSELIVCLPNLMIAQIRIAETPESTAEAAETSVSRESAAE